VQGPSSINESASPLRTRRPIRVLAGRKPVVTQSLRGSWSCSSAVLKRDRLRRAPDGMPAALKVPLALSACSAVDGVCIGGREGTRRLEAARPSHSSTSERRHAINRSVTSVGSGNPRVRRSLQSVGLLMRKSRQTSLARRYCSASMPLAARCFARARSSR